MRYGGLNFDTQASYHVFDYIGMLLVLDDSESWKDSLGRTILAWLAFNRDPRLQAAIESCLRPFDGKNGKHKLLRHPAHGEESSRDHWSYFIIYRRLISTDEEFKEFIKYVPRMRGMNYWMKSLTGSKFHEWLYYTLYIPGAKLGNCWNKCIRCIGGAKSERSDKWWCGTKSINEDGWILTNGHDLQLNLPKWKKAWLHGFKIGQKKIKVLIPLYPIQNRGWQLYVMPESKRKEELKDILSKRFGKHNVLLRLLYGLPVSQEEILAYFNMTGFRGGVNLDETCSRGIRKLTDQEAEYNAYEAFLVMMLFLQLIKKYSNVQ